MVDLCRKKCIIYTKYFLFVTKIIQNEGWCFWIVPKTGQCGSPETKDVAFLLREFYCINRTFDSFGVYDIWSNSIINVARCGSYDTLIDLYECLAADWIYGCFFFRLYNMEKWEGWLNLLSGKWYFGTSIQGSDNLFKYIINVTVNQKEIKQILLLLLGRTRRAVMQNGKDFTIAAARPD